MCKVEFSSEVGVCLCAACRIDAEHRARQSPQTQESSESGGRLEGGWLIN